MNLEPYGNVPIYSRYLFIRQHRLWIKETRKQLGLGQKPKLSLREVFVCHLHCFLSHVWHDMHRLLWRTPETHLNTK
ncbi:hypothetical protein MAR_011530 [Mya arenaria]|uniref:Uncharacterized protein n=1 Tax=Mya arenaria TaxID=6604 RepID=A0ABY7G3F7_MYAAR|nr:hypothetical protein MAR_011530 [Mya arenaria]